MDEIVVHPATHYVASEDRMKRAVDSIEAELAVQLGKLESGDKLLEAQRLRMRTNYDLEMMREVGFCSGIENYSRHLDGRDAGTPPYTLLDYFPDDWLCVIDESHVTVPQLHGMYEGDMSRKRTLVEFGFRLPSAMDNRPLQFDGVQRAREPGRVHVGDAQPLRAPVSRRRSSSRSYARPGWSTPRSRSGRRRDRSTT